MYIILTWATHTLEGLTNDYCKSMDYESAGVSRIRFYNTNVIHTKKGHKRLYIMNSLRFVSEFLFLFLFFSIIREHFCESEWTRILIFEIKGAELIFSVSIISDRFKG